MRRAGRGLQSTIMNLTNIHLYKWRLLKSQWLKALLITVQMMSVAVSKGTLLLKAAERIALRLRYINSQRGVRVFRTLWRDAGRGL